MHAYACGLIFDMYEFNFPNNFYLLYQKLYL